MTFKISYLKDRKDLQKLTIYYGIHSSPFGNCYVAINSANKKQLCGFGFIGEMNLQAVIEDFKHKFRGATLVENTVATRSIIKKIFSSNPQQNIELLLAGTPFQLEVWQALMVIPAGKTTTYQAIAKSVQSPKAVRAVGTAIGKNPIGFLIPCHRVIRKTGELGGYRWGLPCKQSILEWEKEIFSKSISAKAA